MSSPRSPYRRLSLWWDQLADDLVEPTRPALAGDTTADVCIVGAGFTGLWTAYYLLGHDPSLRVVVLEAQTAGFGASGRNGGWCSALFPTSLDNVAAKSSRQGAIALARELQHTVDEVGEVAAAEGIDAGFRKGGTVMLARSPLQLRRAEAEVAEWHSWGFGPADLALLDAAQARELVGATDLLGGTYTPHCAAVQPARLVRGLAAAVERRGAVIHESAPVLELAPGSARTATGSVRARYVIRATEGYTATLAGQRRELMPLYSSMIATEPLPAAVWEQVGLARGETFSEFRSLIIYGQRTVDDRLAFGGRGAPYHLGSRIEPEYDRNARVTDELCRTLTDLFPAVAGHAITHSWGGPLGVPRDWFPSVALDPATGLGRAGGYVGDGVAATNLAGRTLADLVLGRNTALTALPWVGHESPPWEPEPLRWLGATAARWAMVSGDRVEARTGKQSRRGTIVAGLTGH
ncbi:MAG TPA: FAD-dependent oxidoreductase [Candidatus Nanopelagicales bacterium]|nr:FAD-dependent oxidoreductase [Candidatus Nanopelagicales bacterium]